MVIYSFIVNVLVNKDLSNVHSGNSDFSRRRRRAFVDKYRAQIMSVLIVVATPFVQSLCVHYLNRESPRFSACRKLEV